MIRLLIIALFASGMPLLAQSAEVKIRTVSFADNTKGVQSKIYRRVLTGSGDYLITTDNQGYLLWHEPECDKGAMYKAIPVNNISFLAGDNWQQCAPDTEIVF